MALTLVSPSAPFTPFSQVEETAEQLLLVDYDLRLALRAAAACVLTNTEAGTPPLWLMIVGGSSTGKTSAIEPWLDSPAVYKLGVLSAKTFVSGAKNQRDEQGNEIPSSLLNRVGSQRTLVLTDFSIVLSKGREQRDEIMSQLRDIYDGDCRGATGIGTDMLWKGKLGMLAACTEVITEFSSVMASLGERFVYLRLRQSDPLAAVEKAVAVMTAEGALRETLKARGSAFIETRRALMAQVAVSHEREKALQRLAVLCALLRTSIRHDERRYDDRLMAYDADGPTRVAKQLRQMARGLAAVRGVDEVGMSDVADCARIALDSVPQDRRSMLHTLIEYERGAGSATKGKAKGGMTVSDVAKATGKYAYTGTRRALMDLELIGLVCKRDNAGKVVHPADLHEQGAILRWETTAKVPEVLGDLIDLL